MSLRRVRLTHEALFCCVAQALSTERQEVMSVLLGTWTTHPTTGENIEAEVQHVVVMSRTDRRKDRVEVGYTQLAEAEQLASALTKATGQETRILGWFHSHPHITVLPSHVDIRTQAQYQAMDAGFLGLICAVFQDDPKQQKGRVEVTAFQSVPVSTAGGGGGGGGGSAMELDDFIQIDDEASCQHHHPPYDAGAAAAMGGGNYVRKGIPIRLVPSKSGGGGGQGGGGGGGGGGGSSDGPTTDAMRCVVSLQEVLMQEERFFYEAAARTNLRNNTTTAVTSNNSNSGSSSSSSRAGDVHALYNAAVYGKALSSLLEESALPLLNTLESVLLNLRREKGRVRRATERMLASATLEQRRRLEEEEKEEGEARLGGEGGGGGGSGMMDVDERPAAGKRKGGEQGDVGGPSPYSASVMAKSRQEILRRAAEGWVMRRTEKGDGGDEDVMVSLTREYPLRSFAGGGDGSQGFGEWFLSVGGLMKGCLTRIGNGNGNHTVSFSLVVAGEGGGGGKGEGEGKETTVRMLGTEEAVAFWCGRVQPIVCPQTSGHLQKDE